VIKRFLFVPIILFLGYFLFFNLVAADEPGENPPTITLPNPIAPAGDIMQLLNNLLRVLRNFIAPPIVGIMIIIGALQILTAAGDEEKFKTGKKTVLYAVIGYAIILLASGISFIIQEILRSGQSQ